MAAAGIPLATLRADLDRGWPPGARWATTGGAAGAVLEQPAGSRLGFRIVAKEQRLRLRGRVALGQCDRRFASVRLRVATRDLDGAEETLWQGTLRRVGGRALPTALGVDARFASPEEAELVFEAGEDGDAPLYWSGLAIQVEGAAGDLPDPPSSPAPAIADEGGEAASAQPLFSVLTPVHDPPLEVLRETIDSVLAQTFEDWELCLVDDGSSDPEVQEELRRAEATDPRVHLLRRGQAGGIASATNAALALATGKYVALLDHDDLLLPDALAHVATALRQNPGTDMAYSDEELFEADRATHVFAKPHWSPDLLRSQMYTCHLGIYRRSLAEQVGGFSPEFDGSQDFDFALRLSEQTDRVVHIPRVLYRWRVHAGSTAGGGQAKPAAYPAARRAIAEHLQRTGVDADVHFGPWQGIYRVVHRLAPSIDVAVGIVGDPDTEAVRHLAATARDESLSGVDARVVVGASAVEVSEGCADADVVVLCESAVEPLTRFWLARLAGFAAQVGIAAVGAKTVAPDGRVEQAGSAIESGLPVPIMFASGAGDPGPLGIGLLPANVAAVGGVTAFGGQAFRQLGGLQTGLGELAVADYCLRASGSGLRVVSAPDVLVRRVGRAGPVNDLSALERFRRRWAADYPNDPYFDLSTGWPGVESVSASG